MEVTEDIRWSVGELARTSGLTVRTLHHWDAIGLLVPSERTGAGHRRYTAADVRRLYRVLALRRLGLPLGEVAAALDGSDLRDTVRSHLRRVETDLALAEQLRDRLVRLLSALDGDGAPASAEIIDAIEVMTMHEQYYTDEQLRKLSGRADALGPEGVERAQREWAELIDEVRGHMERGTDPAAPEMQELAARWRGLIEQFTGGDPAIRESLQRMYDEQGPSDASHGMVDPEVMAYAAKAMDAGG